MNRVWKMCSSGIIATNGVKHKAGVNEGGWSLAMAYWLKQRLLRGLPREAEGLLRGQ
jgi:hypothetical protein